MGIYGQISRQFFVPGFVLLYRNNLSFFEFPRSSLYMQHSGKLHLINQPAMNSDKALWHNRPLKTEYLSYIYVFNFLSIRRIRSSEQV